MEPARHGRDDEDLVIASPTGVGLPQWSPPVTGGTTLRPLVAFFDEVQPQWSPPVTGGTTPDPHPSVKRHSEPQWSPPVTGGTT